MKLNIDKSNWTPVSFGDVVAERRKTTKDPVAEGLAHIVGLEHIDTGSIHLRRSEPITSDTTFSKTFKKGDVLFGRRRAYLKKAAQAPFAGICSGDITVMYAKDDLMPELLPFLVNNDKFFDYAVEHSAGGLSPRVKFRDLANYQFLLPPKAEQARLAELLWAGDGVLEGLERVRHGIVRYHYAEGKALYQITERVRVKEVSSITVGSTPPKNKAEYWENGTVPWITTGKVNEKFIIGADDFVTEKAVTKKKVVMKSAYSTLVAMIGQGKTRGKSALMKIDATTNQNFSCVTPSVEIDPFFLFYSLYFKYERLRSISQGTNQLALNSDLIGNFKIPWVSFVDQKKIALRILRIDEEQGNIRCTIEVTRALQKSLINQIF